MKKKLLAGILMLACVFSLSACSSAVEWFFSMDAFSPKEEESAVTDEIAESSVSKEDIADEDTPSMEENTAREEAPESDETSVSEEVPASEETLASEEAHATEATFTPATEIPAELSNDIYSFQLAINGTVYQFPMWYSDFEALGWTYEGDVTQTLTSNQYSVAKVWQRDGFKIYTEFANLSMNSAPFSECMVAGMTLEEFYLEGCGWEILLPKGIQYGVSTRDDIIAAYGDPSNEYDGDLYYKMTYTYDRYQEVVLYVSKETGVLNEIELENMTELEGADNSVDPTVPEVVLNYTAPTEVGDDLYQFNIELEGNLYSLPCPVSVFLDNGFTINENNSEMEIAADSFGWIEFRYNNQNYRCIVQNYADYATIVENCFVTTMESSEYGPTYDLTIPGNIRRGDSEESVLKVIENYNYETDTSSSFTYYTVYNPDGSKLNSFTITISEGVVYILEVSNDQNPNEK